MRKQSKTNILELLGMIYSTIKLLLIIKTKRDGKKKI